MPVKYLVVSTKCSNGTPFESKKIQFHVLSCRNKVILLSEKIQIQIIVEIRYPSKIKIGFSAS